MTFVEHVFNVFPFTWTEILCAIVAGAVVGAERQLSGKPIGIRTGILICLSTYAFATFASLNPSGTPDSSRIVPQIITGIGFLGGGVILTRNGIVVGVTSAACIWILAAIGITIGLNFPYTGVKLAVLSVVLLLGIENLEKRITSLHQGAHRKQPKEKGE